MIKPVSIQSQLRLQSRKSVLRLGSVLLSAALVVGGIAPNALASDHDDGELDLKGRSLNLTDLYVFRDGDQNPKASKQDLVLIMNTNPRSLARQQYFFSTNARYEFKIARVRNNNATPSGKPDVTLRFEFGKPNPNQQQPIKITTLREGQTQVAKAITTPLQPRARINQVSIGGTSLSVFAGLREDPFFFDVEQFFRVRAGALGIGPAVGFRPANKAVDFTAGYNVNAIAVRVPIKFLQGRSNATTFDVWETISVPDGKGKFKQIERLARPAINEGLIVSNGAPQCFE